MAGINNVVLVGRLTKDPEKRVTSSGIAYCRFSVAIDRPKKRDEESSTADFPSVVAWRQPAEFVTSYGRKGAMIAVTGSIQTGSYTDRDGRKVYTTDVLAQSVQLLESCRHEKPDYPHNGTSVSRDDISREINNQGFDTGDQQIDIDNDDLPF